MQKASGLVVVILCVCVGGGVSENVLMSCVKVTGCEVGVCGVCVGWAWEVCEAEDMSGWMTFGQMAYIIFIVHMSILYKTVLVDKK